MLLAAWLALGPFASSPAQDPVEHWAAAVLERVQSSPPFLAALELKRAAATSSESSLMLDPGQWAVLAEHTTYGRESPHVAAINAQRLAQLQLSASKYVGWGADVALQLSVADTTFQDLDIGRPHRQQSVDTKLSVGFDLLRDRLGRNAEAARSVGSFAALAQAQDAEASMQSRANELLANAVDLCVQVAVRQNTQAVVKVVHELLAETETRARARVIQPSDLLQFQNLVISLERSLEELEQQEQQLKALLMARFSVVLSTNQCPKLVLPPPVAEPDAAALMTAAANAPAVLAGVLRVKQREAEVTLNELALVPTLRPYLALNGVERDRAISDAGARLFRAASQWGTTAGLEFNWSFWDGKLDLQQRTASEFLIAARRAYDEQLGTLVAQLTQVTVQRESRRRLISMLARQEEITRDYLQQVRTRYSVGRVDAFTLTSAYQDYLRVFVSTPQLVAEWYKAGWQRQALIGTLWSITGARHDH